MTVTRMLLPYLDREEFPHLCKDARDRGIRGFSILVESTEDDSFWRRAANWSSIRGRCLSFSLSTPRGYLWRGSHEPGRAMPPRFMYLTTTEFRLAITPDNTFNFNL